MLRPGKFCWGVALHSAPYFPAVKCPYCGAPAVRDLRLEDGWGGLPPEHREGLAWYYRTTSVEDITMRLMWDNVVLNYCPKCENLYEIDRRFKRSIRVRQPAFAR